MFTFCRLIKKWVASLLIGAYLQLSLACAFPPTLWIEVDEAGENPSGQLSLALYHSALETSSASRDRAKELLAQYDDLRFEERETYGNLLAHDYSFKGRSTPEACSISLKSPSEHTDLNFIVYRDGRVVVKDLIGPASYFDIRTKGDLAFDGHACVHGLHLDARDVHLNQGLESLEDITIKSQGQMRTKGHVNTNSSLTLINGQEGDDKTGVHFINKGTLTARQSFTVTSPQFINRGDLYLPTHSDFNCPFENRGILYALKSTEATSLDFNDKDIINQGLILDPEGNGLSLTRGGCIFNEGQIGSQGPLSLEACVLRNQGQITGVQDVALTADRGLYQEGEGAAIEGGRVSLQSGSMAFDQGRITARTLLELRAMDSVREDGRGSRALFDLSKVWIYTPLLQLHLQDFALPDLKDVKKTLFKITRGQDVSLEHPVRTRGLLEIWQEDLRDESAVEAIMRSHYGRGLGALPSPEHTIRFQETIQADEGVTLYAPFARIQGGSEDKGHDLMVKRGDLRLYAGSVDMIQGSWSAMNALIWAPLGIQVGRLVRDATRDAFVTVSSHAYRNESYNLGRRRNESDRYEVLDQVLHNVFDGRHLFILPVFVSNNATLKIRDHLTIQGPLKNQGCIETRDLTLESDRNSECVASILKVEGNMHLTGPGNLYLKRVMGALYYTYWYSSYRNPENNKCKFASSDLATLRVQGKIASDFPVTLFNQASVLYAHEKQDHIKIQSEDSRSTFYQQFIGGSVQERQKLSIEQYSNNFPRGTTGPVNSFEANGYLPWVTSFLLKTNNFRNSQIVFPAVTSFGSGVVLPADRTQFQGNISTPAMLVPVGQGGVTLGSPHAFYVPPAPVKLVWDLTSRPFNAHTIHIPKSLGNSLDRFSWGLREQHWFDEKAAHRFYKEIQDHIHVLSPQGYRRVSGPRLFALSPRLLLDSVRSQCQEVLKRGYIEDHEVIDDACVQQMHRHATAYFQDTVPNQAIIAPGHPVLSLEGVTKPLILYVPRVNDQGQEVLNPWIVFPESLIPTQGSQLNTRFLAIFSERLGVQGLRKLIQGRSSLEQAVSRYLASNSGTVAFLEEQAALQEARAVSKEIIARPSGDVTIQGICTADQALVVTDGDLRIHGTMEAKQLLLMSLFGDVRVEALVQRIYTRSQENFYDTIVNPARLKAQEIMEILSGNNIILQGAETWSGALGTHMIALANILDVPVPLVHQHVERWSKGFDRTTRVQQHVSRHNSTGVIDQKAEGSICQAAPVFKAKDVKQQGLKGFTSVDVQNTIEHGRQSKRKGNLVRRSKTYHEQSFASYSQGTVYNLIGCTDISILEGDATLTNASFFSETKTPSVIKAPKGKVRINQGVNTYVHQFNSRCSNAFWQKQVSHEERHRTYRAGQLNALLEIYAQETAVQLVSGKQHPFLALLRSQEGRLIHEMLEEEHHRKHHSHSGLTAGASALLALVGSVVMSWTGLTAAMIAELGAVASGMLTAGIIRTGLAIINNKGDPSAILKDITSKDALKSYAIEGLAVYGIDKISTYYKIPMTPVEKSGMRATQKSTLYSLKDHFQANLVRSSVRTSLNLVMYRQNLEHALQEALCTVAANTLGGYGAHNIGDMYKIEHIDTVQHQVLHALNGAMIGGILGGKDGIVPGMIGSTVAELLPKLMGLDFKDICRRLGEGEEASLLEKELNRSGDIGRLSGAMINMSLKEDVNIGIRAGTLTVENNALQFMVAPIIVGTAKLLWEIYSFIYEDKIETYKDRICDSISEETGLPKEVVRTIGVGVVNGLSWASTIKQGVKYVGKKVAQYGAREGVKALPKPGTRSTSGQNPKKGTSEPGENRTVQIPSGDNSNKGLYHPHEVRQSLENKYPGQVTSTTVPSASGKNVKLAGQRHPETGIVFDQRGLPVFDDVAKFDTKLPREIVKIKNSDVHMKEATKDLKTKIIEGKISRNNFDSEQLQAIMKEKERIPGYTWHHHQDVGRMQLIEKSLHQKVGHIGGMNMWFIEKG